tara:strand:- start:1851 stop:2798 length:948 start_codon:yes stop_codon:yes gene_type:complete
VNTTDQSSIDAIAASIIDVDPVEATDDVVEDAEIVEPEEVVEAALEEASDEAEYDEQETDDAVEEYEEPRYAVQSDGKPYHATIDEMRQSFSGQIHINQQNEAIAAAKKELQQAYTEIQAERQFLADFRQRADAGQVLMPPKAPDRGLFKTDPIGYMEAKLKHEEQVEAYQQQEQQIQQVTQRQQAERERGHQVYLHQELQALQEAVPELADREKAPAYRDKMVQAGRQYYGFTNEELYGEPDSRKVRLLNDAMKWRELQESKGLAAQKTSGARPVVKPGAKKTAKSGAAKRAEKAKSRMQTSGSVDDVAAFLLS